MRTVVRVVLIAIAAILALVLVAILALTNTEWGRGEVRRLTLQALRSSAHGIVRLGTVEGNLLRGVTLTDLSITDSAGRPFFSVARARARYAIAPFLSKRIVLDSLVLDRPVIVLDHRPGEMWNYERIFPTSGPPSTTPGFGSWVTLNHVRIIDGHVQVRTPWAPSDSLHGAVRDSVVRAVLAGETRAQVVSVPKGYQAVMDFRAIQAALPHVRVADADSGSRLVRVDTLRMVAFPFRPPGAEIRALHGDFRLNRDSLWFRDVTAALPGTTMRASGRYLLGPGDLAFAGSADPLALGDLRWLYPRLPSGGSGRARFDLAVRPKGESDYVLRDARLTIGSGAVAGEVGIAMRALPESLRVHDTHVRFAGIDTRLIEQLVPGLRIPRRGTLEGSAALAGTLHGMHVDADVAFHDPRTGTSRLVALGGVGMTGARGRGGVQVDSLRLRLAPLQVALVRAVSPRFPLAGTLTGTATIDGSTDARLAARTELVHQDGRAVSRLEGAGTFVGLARSPAQRSVDATVRFDPLALGVAGRFAPALALHGTAAGQFRVAGALRALTLTGDLRLPDGGALEARGRADVASAVKQYDLSAALRVFNLRSVTARGPSTSVTAAARAVGRGTDPETMRAAFAADVSHSSVDSIPFDSLHVRVTVADGMARIDSLGLRTPIAHASVDGTFGLAPGREGTLTYAVQIDSLAGFQRLFPPTDTGVVAPSRARVARALARARADSARIARQTEVERAATGRPPLPRLVVDTVRGIARDSIAGAVYTAGTVRGGLPSFNARGRLALRAVVFRGSGVRTGRVEYELRNVGTRTPVAAVGARLDSVQTAGLALDSVELRASYRKPGGHVDVAVYQDSGVSYRAAADYALRIDRSEVHLLDVGLRFDTTRWAATHPSTIEWGKSGLAIDSVELRSGTAGRIAVNGRLPATGPMHLDVQIAGLEVANLIGLAQGDIAASGEIALSAQLTGTRADPQIRGALGIANATFRGSAMPDLRATAHYADTTLTADAELRHGDQAPLATLSANVPVNLALSGATGSRLLDQPMRVDFRADSLPLDGMPSFTDAVAQVRGDLFGAVAARGTPKHPSLAGRLGVQFASFRVVPMGVTLRQISGDIHLLGDSIVIDSLVGVSGTGPVALRGGIGIATLTRPSFALHITGNDALLMDTDRGRLTASADINVRGPFTRVAITGNARILNGAIYLPAPTGQTVIDLNDSLVYRLVDTTSEEMREVVAPPSPVLANLRADVSLVVSHDTWVRTPEANVEIYSTGPLRIQVDSGARALTVDGVMNTDRGEYTYLGRQFVLSHGAVTFTGGPTLDPLLQISAVRNVDLGGRGALAIQIVIGGTARKPTITLSSDAQPPVSQSDLLSYLAFGQSSSSLLQFGGSSGLDGQNASGGQLAGKAAGLATRQLAAVAVDVVAKQLQTNLARSVGADVLNITPADIPTDFSLSSVETLLAGTQVEAGKYVDRQTFVALQARPTLVAPGIRVERRMRGGYRLQASIEPRFLVRQPTLSEDVTPNATSVFGAFFVREWRF